MLPAQTVSRASFAGFWHVGHVGQRDLISGGSGQEPLSLEGERDRGVQAAVPPQEGVWLESRGAPETHCRLPVLVPTDQLWPPVGLTRMKCELVAILVLPHSGASQETGFARVVS